VFQVHAAKLSFVTGIVAACLAGCGAAKTGPQSTVRQYVDAIRSNRPEQAYALLDAGVRRRVSKNAFLRRWRAHRAELLTQAQQLETSLGRQPEIRARVNYGAGLRPHLVYVGNQWKINEDITTPRTRTPLEALQALIQAMEHHDYQGLVRLLSKAARAGLEDRLTKLKKGIHMEIEVTGNRARLQYDPQYKIELHKEEGQWKIDEFD
jgi:hypothetical protein